VKSTTKWILGISAVFLVALVLLVMSIVSFLFSPSDEYEDVSGLSGSRIAIVEVKEAIFTSENIVRQLKKYRESKAVKSIVLRVESPGGGVAASQEIYEEVRKTREGGKPVVVSMGSVAASGGYYIACGATRIVANPGTLTGSIGVIFQYLEFEELMDKVGVGSNTFKSGTLKDMGSPLRKSTRREREYFDLLVQDVYEQFLAVVIEERGLEESHARRYADGRVFTGRQALAWGFVDSLGTYEDAIAIAADLAGIEGKPRILKERKKRSFVQEMMGEAVIDMTERASTWMNRPMLQYHMVSPR
jgi:protease-4